MKIKLVVIDVELTRRQKIGGAAALCAALAIGTSYVQAVPHEFVPNTPLLASQLNENFQEIDARIGPWQNYTPVLMRDTTNAAVGGATSNGYWRRVGDSVELRIRTTFSAAPVTGATWWHWSLPPGLTIDDDKLGIGGPLPVDGDGYGQAFLGPSAKFAMVPYRRTSTSVSASPAGGPGVGYINDTSPANWGAGHEMSISVTMPIVGWDVPSPQ